MVVALQLVTVAAVPLNVTVLVPWVEPKLVPVMVMEACTAADVGEMLPMPGGGALLPPVKAEPELELVKDELEKSVESYV
jgi:hypothetical protein